MNQQENESKGFIIMFLHQLIGKEATAKFLGGMSTTMKLEQGVNDTAVNLKEEAIIRHQKFVKTVLIAGVVLFVSLIISFSAGYASAVVDINGKEVSYKQIEKEIEKVNGQLKDKQDSLAAQDQRLNDRKAEVDKILALVGKQKDLNADIDAKTKEVDNKKNQISTLDSDIQAKQAELDKLTSGVVAKKEEPRQLSAGSWYIGKDVPVGRYKAVPVGHGSNFFVYSSTGDLKVNAILGTSIGVPEYVFDAEDGDVIKTETIVKLIPIQ